MTLKWIKAIKKNVKISSILTYTLIFLLTGMKDMYRAVIWWKNLQITWKLMSKLFYLFLKAMIISNPPRLAGK